MHLCPNCGINLKRFEPETFGNVTIDESQNIVYKGQAVKLYPSGKLLIEALIRANGRTLTRDAMGNILDYDADIDIHGTGNALNAHMNRARRAFQKIDKNFDQIVNDRFIGYRWRVENYLSDAA